MNTISRLAALAVFSASVAASGAAFAQEATYELPLPAVSTTSRAAVQAELLQARADGTLRVTEADLNRHDPVQSLRSRADVRAETLAARASGELQAVGADDNSFDGHVAAASRPVRIAGITR